MARNVTLTQLLSDIREQIDIAGASARTSDALITRYTNQAIQKFRERLSNEGATHFLTSTTGTLTAGATSPYPFGVLDLSAVSPSVVRTYGVDLTISGVVKSLRHVGFNDRDMYGGPYTAEPEAWAHYQTRKLAILPPPDAAYTYVVWYLPVLADLASGSDTFDGVAGWEDYIVWDVCSRLIIRDKYPDAFAMVVQYRSDVWTDILRNATKVSSAGAAVTGRDSIGKARRDRVRIEPPRN